MPDATAYPDIVSNEAWLEARKALLVEEKRVTRERDAVNAMRRRLPMVRVEKDYTFEGPKGALTLRDLFGDARQLFIGHFMFDPEWENGCSSCSHLADEISPAHIRHLADGDTAFAYVSRAPIDKIESYKAKRGWTFPWVSSFGSDFNYDFGATFDPEKGSTTYNYKTEAELVERNLYGVNTDQSSELPGFSVFLRIDDDVFHTYSTYGRGGETFGGAHYMLDMTVWGRRQDFEASPKGWPQAPTYG